MTSETTAVGVWAMEESCGGPTAPSEEHLHGYGHYHEEYRKVGDDWLISRRRLTRCGWI